MCVCVCVIFAVFFSLFFAFFFLFFCNRLCVAGYFLCCVFEFFMVVFEQSNFYKHNHKHNVAMGHFVVFLNKKKRNKTKQNKKKGRKQISEREEKEAEFHRRTDTEDKIMGIIPMVESFGDFETDTSGYRFIYFFYFLFLFLFFLKVQNTTHK